MNQIMIVIDPAVMRVYQTEAAKRGYPSGQALISALLADWPAILAPVTPKGAVAEAQETPFGGGY